MKSLNRVITVSVLGATALLAVSPNIPNSSTINRQIQAPKDVLIKKNGISTIDTSSFKERLKIDESNQTIFIKRFKLKGNTKIDSKEILKTIKSFENKELTFKQIEEVTSIITKLYQDKGYFVARAYIGKQDILKSDNTLVITILEGSYGEIKIKNNSLVNDSVVKQIFDKAKDSGVINIKTIEKAMLLINSRAGIKVSNSDIRPGKAVGSSDLNIQTVSYDRVDGYILADNYGSRYTGEYRAQALISVNSPFRIGDKLSFSGLLSNQTNLKNGRLAYELPLNSYGLKADFAYNKIDYALVKEYINLDASGISNIYEIGLSYPLVLSNDTMLISKIKYYHKDFSDYMYNKNLLSSDKNIDAVVASLDFDKSYFLGNFPSRISSSLNLTRGYLEDKINSNRSGRYNKIDTYISNEIAFNEILSLNSILTAQKVLGNESLDGSEDISLGGAYGVKLYPYSEQSDENGYIFSTEFFTKLPTISTYTHKLGIFYDIGDVYQEKNLDATFKRKRLKDIGLGYYANYKDFFAKVQMAWAANSTPITSEQTNHRNYKLLFQTGWVF